MHPTSIAFHSDRGGVTGHAAWTTGEVKAVVERLLGEWAHRLPARLDARIVIKPNLNNDLVALVGNCVDLRVLCSLVEGLLNRGYHDLTIADGSNVGIARRDIDTFRRLRVDKLTERYGVKIVDLNKDDGVVVQLSAGAHPEVARTVLDCDFLISVPKVKTHAEAQMSCAMKNWVGIARNQDKREMHKHLGQTIATINEAVMPDLVLVDGLVGMEGNGPGDGEPFRFGWLLASDSAFVNDLVVARLIDLPWREVPYLVVAEERGQIDAALADDVERAVPVLRPIKRAPARSRLAEISEARALTWLKLAVRPALEYPPVIQAAYRLKIVQDVYSRQDDTVTGVRKKPGVCGTCARCADFCPTHLSAEDIGVKTGPEDCITCLYCWWVCPKDGIELVGELNHLERQVERYKAEIELI